MQLGEVFDDDQTESETAMVAASGDAGLGNGSKTVGGKSGAMPRPLVAHDDAGIAALTSDLDLDEAAR